MIGTGGMRRRGVGRGIEADFGPPAAAGPNTFRRDLHPDLRADYVLAKRFDDSVQPLFLQREQNGRQSRTLGILRDSLLPKLLSGELLPATEPL